MEARSWLLSSIAGTTLLVSLSASGLHAQPYAIVGNDEKVTWDNKGNTILAPPGKD